MDSAHQEPSELQQLRRAEQMVRRVLRSGLGIDEESIATDLWVESWMTRRPITWRAVRARCIDAIRASSRRRLVEIIEAADVPTKEPSEERADASERLNLLMKCPWLSSRERQLLYLRYYAQQTDREISVLQQCSREKITKDVATALEKLRQWAFLHEPSVASEG